MARRNKPRRNNPAALKAAQAALAVAPLLPALDDWAMGTERKFLKATAGRTRYGAKVLAAHDRLTPYRKAPGRFLAAGARRIQELKPLVAEAQRVRAEFKNPKRRSRREADMLISDAFGPLPDWAEELRAPGRGAGRSLGKAKARKNGAGPSRRAPKAKPRVGQQGYVKGKPAVVVAVPAPGTKTRIQVRFHNTGALMSVTSASFKTSK